MKRGFNLLTAVWPSRYATQAELRAGMVVYADLLGDISDTAWLAACREAATTCRFFPVPAELTELAEAFAETAYLERVEAINAERLAESNERARHLLTTGAVTEEDAAAKRELMQRQVADMARHLREVNANARRPQRGDWQHEDRAVGNQRIADGHWDTPKETPND